MQNWRKIHTFASDKMRKAMNDEQKERIVTVIITAMMIGGFFGLAIGLFLGAIIF